MQLAWLSHTRSDLMYETSQMTQMTANNFREELCAIIRRLNRTVEYAKKIAVQITFRPLDPCFFQPTGYSDASFAMAQEATSQLLYIVFLQDDTSISITIIVKLHKARIVVLCALLPSLTHFLICMIKFIPLPKNSAHCKPALKSQSGSTRTKKVCSTLSPKDPRNIVAARESPEISNFLTSFSSAQMENR